MSLVYSTDKGRLCPDCAQPKAQCICKQAHSGSSRSAGPGDGIVRMQRQTQGRAGKAVIVISGLDMTQDELKTLAKTLKQRCGCGGAVKDNTIEIQGDHRAVLKTALEELGYNVKLAGG